MEQQKKRGRPVGSKNKTKDPMIAAVEAPKKRGRPAGTRAKHRVTVQSVKKNWEKMYNDLLDVNNAASQEIIALSVELKKKDELVEHLAKRVTAADQHIEQCNETIRRKDVRETKLFGIIEYLEDKVKNAIKSDSI